MLVDRAPCCSSSASTTSRRQSKRFCIASDATKKRLRKRVRDAAFPRRILDAKSAPKALEWASGLFGGNLLPKKGEPGYAKIVQKFRDVRKLYDDDSD